LVHRLSRRRAERRRQPDAALRKALTCFVNRYRLAGQDLQLESPSYVPLNIKLTVCVDSAYFQANVRQALTKVLGAGRSGLRSDTFRFGQTFT